MQTTRKLIHIRRGRRNKQTARGLRIVQRIQHARLQVLVGRHARAKEVLVAVGARGDNAQTRHVEHLVKERHRPRCKLNLHARTLGHLARVPDQTKARNVGAAVKLKSLGQTNRCLVEGSHRVKHGCGLVLLDELALNGRGDDARANRLGQQ